MQVIEHLSRMAAPVEFDKPTVVRKIAPKPAPVVAPKLAPVVAPKPAPVVAPKPAPVVAPQPKKILFTAGSGTTGSNINNSNLPVSPVTGLPLTKQCFLADPKTKTLPKDCVCPVNKTWKAGANGFFKCQ